MSSIKDKVNYLLDTKTILRTALIAAGANINANTPFREYANYVQGLVPSGTVLDLELMQAQNYIDVHIQGGKNILTIPELNNIYLVCQEYMQKHLQEENNE